MNATEFTSFVLDHWVSFSLLTVFCTILAYLCVRKIAVAGIFDPIHFTYTFTYGTTYATVVSLYLNGYIKNYLFLMVASYGVLFVVLLNVFSRMNTHHFRRLVKVLLTPPDTGRFEFMVTLLIYFLISAYVIHSIGFGLFAATNRFDINRGYGVFVRILDLFRLFIIAYSTVFLVQRHHRKRSGDLTQYVCYALLLFFILYSSILNGAKAALLESFFAVIVATTLKSGARVKFGFFKTLALVSAVMVFAVLGLMINLGKNNVSMSGGSQYVGGVPIIVERFVDRILANGNQSYMSLPNEVIERIQTDSVFVRFLAPIVGTTKLSSLLGYNVGDYSVGRQIILYYDPSLTVAGGPTSHFDLFAYKYFGTFGGVFFIAYIAFVIGMIYGELRAALTDQYASVFYISLLTTLAIRSMSIIMEPTTGLAYVLDVFIVFFVLKAIGMLVRASVGSGKHR